MPKVIEKEEKVSRHQAIRSQEDIRAQMDELMQEAELIEQIATEEKRGFSDEENERILEINSSIEDLRKTYEERAIHDRQAVTAQLIQASRESVESLPSPAYAFEGVGQRVRSVRPMWREDPKRRFSSFGEFAMTCYHMAMTPGYQDDRVGLLRQEAAVSGMSQSVGADGGLLVPPQFRSDIWDGLQSPTDNIFALTDQYQVEGESLEFPAVGETSRAAGSRWGGVRAYWLAEGAQLTGSLPRLRGVKLEPQELAVLVYATDKLLRNASALESYLRRAATEEILFAINNAILNGTGAGQPTGVLNSPALVTIAAEVGQAADTVVLENINKMWARMHSRARAGAIWFCNQDVESQLESLSATAGTAGFPVYLPQGSGGPTIQEASVPRLKGRPVQFVEYCQTLGTVGDIVLMNPTFYATGIQGQIRDDMSMHLRFDYAETAFRFMFAVDGRTWLDSALTPLNGTNTLSAYVALATR